nr:PREDICTED: uncharacterized protein LOC109043032 [Bemisia tabaci]
MEGKMSVLESIKSGLLPALVEQGKFGADQVEFIDFVCDDKMSASSSYQSTIFFGDIVTNSKAGDSCVRSIVIKTLPEHIFNNQPSGSLEWDYFLQFQNELLFYTEVIPLLTECDSDEVIAKLFPKFFHASIKRNGSSTDNILILENVQKLGFKLHDSKALIDYDHIKLTLEWLGKFHALSLVCKKRFPGRFRDVCAKISEAAWTEERIVRNPDAFYVENCKRGIRPLREDPKYRDKLREITDAIRKADLMMAKLVAPVEPLAVICLGDFCRNNIFYRCDAEGKPSDTMFFDFGTFRYASPVVDMSFFLFMNSSPEFRSLHWDEMLRTYHSALVSNPDIDIREAPTLGDVILDFRRRGLYGYVHAAFFLPYMLRRENEDEDFDWYSLSGEDLIKRNVSIGGERATGYVADIVKHMIDKQFDFKFVEIIETKFEKKL